MIVPNNLPDSPPDLSQILSVLCYTLISEFREIKYQ